MKAKVGLIFTDDTRSSSAHALCFITIWLAKYMHFSSLSLNSQTSFYFGEKNRVYSTVCLVVCSNILSLSQSPSSVSFFLFVFKHVNIETCTYYKYTVYQYKTKYMRQSDDLLLLIYFSYLHCIVQNIHTHLQIYIAILSEASQSNKNTRIRRVKRIYIFTI
jgi:hypothetical protein